MMRRSCIVLFTILMAVFVGRMRLAAAPVDEPNDSARLGDAVALRLDSVAVQFGFKVYRWLNHALNYYDTAYVVNPGKGKKKFKVMIKNSNWLDFYSGHLGKWGTPLQLNSDITSLFGFHISGMGLSFTYMINARDLLAGKFIRNRRLQFSFTTSRIFIEGYYRKNDQSTVHLHRLGRWMGDEIFSGLMREGYGLDAYYIFNHTHYSQAAAYCFSKYQKRSSGSLLAGIYLSHQDVVMDMSILRSALQRQLPGRKTDYRFRYRDFGFMIGYGYSWVFHHTPSISTMRGTGIKAPCTASTTATATSTSPPASVSRKMSNFAAANGADWSNWSNWSNWTNWSHGKM